MLTLANGLCAIDIYHNIMWSRYKAVVFAKIHELASAGRRDVRIIQIAETERQRQALGGVELSVHAYPYELLFRGAYEDTSFVRLAWVLFWRAARSQADLLVLPGYHRPEYWLMLAACVLRRKPRGVFCDSTLNDQPHLWWKSALKRAFFSLCDGFFCYGERSRELLLAHGVDESSIFTRCQAAALPPDYSEADAYSARLGNAPRADAPRYLYVGRLSPEKGLDVLLQALQRLLTSIPAATLVIVGAGPLRAELQAQVEQMGLKSQVEFAGPKGLLEVAIEYSRATCLVLPSRTEPWGLVVNEALSYGCPVVVSNACGCVPELVLDGISGYCFETDDVAALAAKMEAAAALGNVADIARNCQRLISRYSPEAAACQILAGCDRLYAKSRD
jgi:glycosyltransferase involved in cell wall biosynthesis